MSNIDTSGVSLFKELKQAMEKKGIEARMLNSDKLSGYLFTLTEVLKSQMVWVVTACVGEPFS